VGLAVFAEAVRVGSVGTFKFCLPVLACGALYRLFLFRSLFPDQVVRSARAVRCVQNRHGSLPLYSRQVIYLQLKFDSGVVIHENTAHYKCYCY
jgi:hypothetical protein